MSGGTIVNRWTRSRIVSMSVRGRNKLGYWDSKAQTLHPETPEADGQLRQALEVYWASGGHPANPHGTLVTGTS